MNTHPSNYPSLPPLMPAPIGSNGASSSPLAALLLGIGAPSMTAGNHLDGFLPSAPLLLLLPVLLLLLLLLLLLMLLLLLLLLLL